MYRIALFAALTLVLAVAGCTSPSPQSDAPQAETEAAQQEAEQEESAQQPDTATPPQSWVDERTSEARERLNETEAGKLVLRSIEAHGGLSQWYSKGALHFRFDYSPLGDKSGYDTYQTVDTWSSRARQQMTEDRDKEFGWDGEQAWVSPKDAELPVNPRFWALTPYYFVAVPFVLADKGVQLDKQGTAELHGREHDVIKATFAEGVGDSPDDYYVIYLDAETGHFGGLRYIVAYPGFFPDGGHSPEKLMVYEGEQTVDGITFATDFSTYKWDAEAEERGEKVTEVEMSDVEFRPDTLDSYFDVPEGAKVIEGY